MAWIKGLCKGKDVWIEVGAEGKVKDESGRVPVRYSADEGAKIYRANPSNVEPGKAPPEELPAGVSADAGPGRPGKPATGFGKAGERTEDQAERARVAGHALVEGFEADVAVCFTDGACQGNPGPCGAGALVKLPGGAEHEKFAALGKGTNNKGELSAIGLALDLLDTNRFPIEATAEILTDSQYAYGVLTLGWKAKANLDLVSSLKARLKARKTRLHWVAGHVGIEGNERADRLANKGVEESKRFIR
jgi:ribonuclease HI